MQHAEERTSRCCNEDLQNGWSTMGQRMTRRAAKEIDDKLDHFALSLDCTPTTSNSTTDDTEILDSGCTINLLSPAAPCSDKQAAHVLLNVNMPNGTTIQ
jgi:hypothetical protein